MAGQRRALAQAITLIESSRRDHRLEAETLLSAVLPRTGGAVRLGISGVPGVGKSTFIESFGLSLIEAGKKVAVLAVDPSSRRSGGSILGDKTRMTELASDPNAFIRPSPSSGTLGGVTRATRETMVVCEAAGYDVVLVETVGAGQSEVAVADMTDFFLVLMLPGAGDELQGIKKGVLEIADMIAVNKADVDELQTMRAIRDYANALHIVTPATATWTPPVVSCSGLKQTGLDVLWEKIEDHRAKLTKTGEFEAKRQRQQIHWLWSLVEDRLMSELRQHPRVVEQIDDTERAVAEGRLTPTLGADVLLDAFGKG